MCWQTFSELVEGRERGEGRTVKDSTEIKTHEKIRKQITQWIPQAVLRT